MTTRPAVTPAKQAPHHTGVQLLLQCSRLLRRHFAAQLGDIGLTEPQWRVLAFVSRSEGLSQTELAALLGLHKVALGEHIERLRQMGYVERATDAADRRTRHIFLAAAGEPVIQRLRQRFGKLTEHIEQALDGDWESLECQLQLVARHTCAPATLRALDRLTMDTSAHLLGVLARLMGRHLDRLLAPFGLSQLQWLALLEVRQHPAVNQTELAATLSMSKAALGQMLDVLETGAWLERSADVTDRRIRRLSLNQSMLSRLDDIQCASAQLEQLVVDSLGKDGGNAFELSLGRLRAHLAGY